MFIFQLGCQRIHWGKNSFFNKWCRDNWTVTGKNKIEALIHSIYKG